jgi:hypothetical protein
MTAPTPVKFRTNLDGYERAEWPKELPGTPAIGHMVEARPAPGSPWGRRLRIVQIVWRHDGSLELELHR